MTITLLLQLSLEAPLHQALHNPCVKNQRIYHLFSEKLEGVAQDENPKTIDITKIKWGFNQLGMDVILLRHWPVSRSTSTSQPRSRNWSSSKQTHKMMSCKGMAALPAWRTTGMAALPAWRTYWAFTFQKMFEKTEQKVHFLKGHMSWWGIRFPMVMLT